MSACRHEYALFPKNGVLGNNDAVTSARWAWVVASSSGAGMGGVLLCAVVDQKSDVGMRVGDYCNHCDDQHHNRVEPQHLRRVGVSFAVHRVTVPRRGACWLGKIAGRNLVGHLLVDERGCWRSVGLRVIGDRRGLFEDAGYYVVVVGLGDLGAVEGAGD